MTRLALHLNDAGITAMQDDRLVYRAPGFALLDDDGLLTGNEAFAQARLRPRRIQNRYWYELNSEPLSDLRFAHVSAADLVSRQLEQLWKPLQRDIQEVVIAVPAYMKTQNLSLLLGIATELKMPVVGMVESAVAATRREYRGAIPFHIDIALHAMIVTRLAQPGSVKAERSEILEGHGLNTLYDTWIHAIAAEFVQQCRFDPLHTAETEQFMLDQLPTWLEIASRQPKVSITIAANSASYVAEIDSLDLVSAAAPTYQTLANKLTAMCRADEVPALQLSSRAGLLPGLAKFLQARVGGEVFMLEAGATSRGALARVRGSTEPTRVALLRQLPWDQVAVAVTASTNHYAGSDAPTHVLLGHEAHVLNEMALIIGSRPGDGGRTIDLGSDMPGVSRRHCEIRMKNGQCMVEDFSRYGTFLNGHRIDGSALLRGGDSLRVGSPGHEFLLIAIGKDHGA